MHNLFFELLQLAVGSRHTLSFTPSAKDWTEAFDNAKKQALVGICFKGVQGAFACDAKQVVNLPPMMKMQWLALLTSKSVMN